MIVLPNNKNIVAGGASRSTRSPSKPVAVVADARAWSRRSPRSSSTTPTPTLDDNAAAMDDAAGARARRRGHAGGARQRRPSAGRSRKGDWIAIDARRHPRRRRSRRPTPRVALLDELVDDDSEIVTVLVGADAARRRHRSASASTSRSRIPHVEVEFHDGGQPLYPYLVGVE